MNDLAKQNELLRQIKNFCLMDDDFMTKCFEENIEAIELVLHIILNKPDIRVDKIVTQYSLKNIKGRSLRLDIYAVYSSYKNLRMSTASCSSKLISRFAISLETSSAALYWFRYWFSDLTPILQPSVIRSAIV